MKTFWIVAKVGDVVIAAYATSGETLLEALNHFGLLRSVVTIPPGEPLTLTIEEL